MCVYYTTMTGVGVTKNILNDLKMQERLFAYFCVTARYIYIWAQLTSLSKTGIC